MHCLLRHTPFLLIVLGLMGCSDNATEQSNAMQRDNSATQEQAGSLPDGISLIEEVVAEGDEVIIPYSKYRLDNGLTLIIHEDHSDPMVHVDVTYHVGSAREEPQRSGFAHFFEHMMFQGSENVGDDEHFRIITEAGGTMNGTTNTDRTNYFQTVPSNQLETTFWLESDRMGFLLGAVTQEKFEVQRDTVKNERGQNVDNAPYGRFNEVNNAALYPPSHPYSWPVIGYPEDLDAATLEDLKNFFLRWYGPNNATVTVGGDVDKAEALRLAVQYFGEIPVGPAVEDASYPAVTLEEDRYVSYVDDNIRFPALLFTFPTVPLDHDDSVALNALNSIISEGRKSFFYKEFVLTQKAIQASGFNNSMELAGSLTFFVLPFPGTALSEFESEMRAVFDNFDEDSITEEDILIFRNEREASLISSLTSVRGKASRLAYNETFLDDPDQIRQDLEDIRNLTKEDVLRVFNTYVKDKPAVIQSVVPSNNPDGQAQPDNYTIPERLERMATGYDDLEERDIISSFDRSIKPEPAAAPLVNMPAFWQTSLDNGIDMIGTENSEVPMTTLRLTFEGGHLLEDPEQYGLASLTAMMMNEGTENYSAEAFEIELRKLGSNISVGSGIDTFTVALSSLDRNLDATLALLEERLLRSAFTQEDLDRLRQQQMEAIEADREQPSAIAANVYRTLLYGEEHALAVRSAGTLETLPTITLQDIEDFKRRSLVSGSLDVVVVGDIPQEALLSKLAFLDQLPNESNTLREQPAPPTIDETTLYLVDKPGAPQSEIRIGYMTELSYDPIGEFFERSLMNYPLGGAFNSRINLNLREDKGYTYGARTGFQGSKRPGPFTASASVRTDSTADSVIQFMTEMRDYHDNGITPTELAFTKDAVGQSEALDYETPGQKSGLLQRIITYDLDADYVSQQQTLLQELTVERVNELAQAHLPVDRMYIVVVGDKNAIGDSLVALGYPVVELDTEGQPITP